MTNPGANGPPKKRREWRATFLEMFAETGNVSIAAAAAGIGRRHVYKEREKNAEFREAWTAAEEIGTEGLEQEARRRALASSDVLLIFLLKSRRPEIYRDRYTHDVNLGARGGGPIRIEVNLMEPLGAGDE